MGSTTPNISIYIPAAGETNYDAPFAAGMINIDLHDHSGPPTKGVQIASSGLAPGSVTYPILNANVVDTSSGLGTHTGGLANQITTTGLLNSLATLATSTGILAKNGTNVAARTITGTAGQITVVNGDGSGGNPTLSIPASFLSSKIVQFVTTNVVTFPAVTATIPDDDTIPQQTEGTQVMTLSITPTSATNTLLITVLAQVGISGFDDPACGIAIFQDATANAIQAHQFGGVQGIRFTIAMSYSMVAGTTSATAFNINLGNSGTGATLTLNGITSDRKYGGATSSNICIYEIAP